MKFLKKGIPFLFEHVNKYAADDSRFRIRVSSCKGKEKGKRFFCALDTKDVISRIQKASTTALGLAVSQNRNADNGIAISVGRNKNILSFQKNSTYKSHQTVL